MNPETLRHKIHLLTDHMVDVAHDLQGINHLALVAKELLRQSEALSLVAEAIPGALAPEPLALELGDHIYHAPSKSFFIVREVVQDCVVTCEYPKQMLFAHHCKLIYKATETERHALKQELDAQDNMHNDPDMELCL